MAPHMIEMVKAEPKLDWGKLVLPPGAIALTTARSPCRNGLLKLFGVLTFFVGGLGVYVGSRPSSTGADFGRG